MSSTPDGAFRVVEFSVEECPKAPTSGRPLFTFEQFHTLRNETLAILSRYGERFANHRLVTGGQRIAEGCDSSQVTDLPLVRRNRMLAHFHLGQIHQQLREVQLGIHLVPGDRCWLSWPGSLRFALREGCQRIRSSCGSV